MMIVHENTKYQTWTIFPAPGKWSEGDAALFGGHTTQVMKDKYGITKTRPLAQRSFMEQISAKLKRVLAEKAAMLKEAIA